MSAFRRGRLSARVSVSVDELVDASCSVAGIEEGEVDGEAGAVLSSRGCVAAFTVRQPLVMASAIGRTSMRNAAGGEAVVGQLVGDALSG